MAKIPIPDILKPLQDAAAINSQSMYDEFAVPKHHELHTTSPTLEVRIRNRLAQVPIYPVGFIGFVAAAGVGIVKYRLWGGRLGLPGAILGITAKGLVGGAVAAGFMHFVNKDFLWSLDHPNEPRVAGSKATA